MEARISAPVNTGPGAHSATHTMDTVSIVAGVKRLEGGVDHPPQSGAEVKERAELNLYSPSGSSWPFLEKTLPTISTHLSSGSLYPEVKWPECEAYFHLVLRL